MKVSKFFKNLVLVNLIFSLGAIPSFAARSSTDSSSAPTDTSWGPDHIHARTSRRMQAATTAVLSLTLRGSQPGSPSECRDTWSRMPFELTTSILEIVADHDRLDYDSLPPGPIVELIRGLHPAIDSFMDHLARINPLFPLDGAIVYRPVGKPPRVLSGEIKNADGTPKSMTNRLLDAQGNPTDDMSVATSSEIERECQTVGGEAPAVEDLHDIADVQRVQGRIVVTYSCWSRSGDPDSRRFAFSLSGCYGDVYGVNRGNGLHGRCLGAAAW